MENQDGEKNVDQNLVKIIKTDFLNKIEDSGLQRLYMKTIDFSLQMNNYDLFSFVERSSKKYLNYLGLLSGYAEIIKPTVITDLRRELKKVGVILGDIIFKIDQGNVSEEKANELYALIDKNVLNLLKRIEKNGLNENETISDIIEKIKKDIDKEIEE